MGLGRWGIPCPLVHARVQGRAARQADRARRERVGEEHAPGREAVGVRRADVRLPVSAEFGPYVLGDQP